MADVRESFPNLEGASGEGLALRSVQEGESVASKNGQLSFSFKDPSGNAVAAPVKASGNAPGQAVPTLAAKDNSGNLIEIPVKQAGQAPGDAVPVLGFRDSGGNLVQPQLSAGGQVPVSFDVGTELYDRGTATGSLTNVDVAVITLTATEVYKGIEFIVSCFREAIFEIVQVDDATTTIIAEALVGPGNHTHSMKFDNMLITAGASGTQELKIRAKNLALASDFRATLATVQLP